MNTGHLSYKGLVYPWHCDHMGHMNVMWYVGKFDEATWAFFATIGLIPSELRAADRGMAALEQHITYKREVVAGDNLEIYSEPIEIKQKTIRFYHEMINLETGDIVATTELIGAHLDKSARKAVAFPDEVIQKASKMIKENT